jgi:hypothetical protein
MAIKIIIRKPVQAPATPPATPVAVTPPKAVLEAPSAPERVIPRCKYCGHAYLNGGCNFEKQKTCPNHSPGKKRKIATKSLD